MTPALRLVERAQSVRRSDHPAERLRALAARVRRLSLVGRLDIERSFIERDDLARELVRLARDLEHA